MTTEAERIAVSIQTEGKVAILHTMALYQKEGPAKIEEVPSLDIQIEI